MHCTTGQLHAKHIQCTLNYGKINIFEDIFSAVKMHGVCLFVNAIVSLVKPL